MTFELNRTVQVTRDPEGRVRHLGHFLRPYLAPPDATLTARELADAYLRDVAVHFRIKPEWLTGLSRARFEPVPLWPPDLRDLPLAYRARSEEEGIEALRRREAARLENRLRAGYDEGVRLRFAEEKGGMGTQVVSYVQTVLSLPVWEAGFSVTIQTDPLRVTGSQSSIRTDIPPNQLDSLRQSLKYAVPEHGMDRAHERLCYWLGLSPSQVQLNAATLGVFQYEKDRWWRNAKEAEWLGVRLLRGDPDIPSGWHCVVLQTLFTLRGSEGRGPVHYRAFLEVRGGALVYVQCLSAAAVGMVYRTDPLSASGDPNLTHNAALADLNKQRMSVTLTGLNAPAAGAPQELTGTFVALSPNPPNQAAPPTDAAGPFHYDVTTTDFAAVNAYYHCDSFYRLVARLGFNTSTYFDGTAFPVAVQHWMGPHANAYMHGNAAGDGCERFEFGAVDPSATIGLAADARVVAHEFAHAVLIDTIHHAHLAFAHSFGDSLAAICCDPDSQAPNGALTFPWIPGLANREHQRPVGAGWSWGGSHDDGNYKSEQILSTTLFRLYQSLGGGAKKRPDRRPAADLVLYLLLRAVGALPLHSVTPTGVEAFADALMAADVGTAAFQGQPGGAVHKVIRWSFEKQGLYRPATTPFHNTPGAPPEVDVFLNDGRGGEYDFSPTTPFTKDVWNRRLADAQSAAESPLAGQVNHLYVCVHNRGTQDATKVIVFAYQSSPTANLADPQWPQDWQVLNTAGFSLPKVVPSGGSDVAGPIPWTPHGTGQVGVLIRVTADGDPSNIDPGVALPCAVGPIATNRLVRWDNNLGLLLLQPVTQ